MESTTRTRELGIALRGIREDADLTGDELAKMLGWSPSKVSRLEHGKRLPSEVDIALYVASCGVLREKLEEVLELARATDRGYWVRPHNERLPDELHSLTVQENIATAISTYNPIFIPGLLQTKDYADTLFRRAGLIPEDGIDLRVHTRMRRQRVLAKYDAPRFVCCIHEHALRTMVGGPEVMHGQIMRLLEVFESSNCQVWVLPRSANSFSAVGSGFRVMSYTDHRPVAYEDTRAAGVFFDMPGDVAMYRQVFTKVTKEALTGEQSRQWLARLANEYDRME